MAAQSERAIVDAYGDGGFRISGISHAGSVFILPDGVLAWSVTAFDDVKAGHFDPVLAQSQVIDILLLGCGRHMQAVPPEVSALLKACGIAVEVMDTGAACRVYNVLVGEGRRVAAALIAV